MRRTTIAVLGVVVVVAVSSAWLLLTDHGSPTPLTTASSASDSTPSSAPPSTTTASSAIPTTVLAPVELGHQERSAVGAVRAGVRMLKLDERLIPHASPQIARALTDAITARSARDRLGARAEQHQREILAKGDLQGLRLRLAPIAARTLTYTEDRAVIELFFLRLWSFPAKGALDDYATANLHLVWEDDAWRLTDSSVIDGPYPVARFSSRPVLASSAARFEELLAGFNNDGLTP